MRLSRRTVIGTATIAGLLALWAVLTMVTGTIDTLRFPSPVQFWQSARQIATTGYADGTLLSHALHSLKLVVMGFLVAAACGHPARAADGLEPPRRSADQSGVPAHPPDSAAGLDSAGDPLAGPRRRAPRSW